LGACGAFCVRQNRLTRSGAMQGAIHARIKSNGAFPARAQTEQKIAAIKQREKETDQMNAATIALGSAMFAAAAASAPKDPWKSCAELGFPKWMYKHDRAADWEHAFCNPKTHKIYWCLPGSGLPGGDKFCADHGVTG